MKNIKIALYAVFSSLILLFALNPASLKAQSGPSDPEQMAVNVMLVIYDPIMENLGGIRLHQWQGPQTDPWNQSDPVQLSTELVNSINSKSHDRVKYQIVQTVVRDEWPIHTNGQRYTDSLYVTESTNRNWTLGPGNYNAIINDNGIQTKVNNGDIDEVWLWGGPGFGWWEATTAGNGAYSTNGGPVTGVNSKVFSLMGFSYKELSGNMFESYGHRIEGIMTRAYGGWAFPYGAPPAQHPSYLTPWDQFTVKNYDPGSLIGCSFAHGSLNTPSFDGTNNPWSYDWSNTTDVASTCSDFLNYPNLTGAAPTIDCAAWGCTQYGFLTWWMERIPSALGTHDGYLPNWWRYIIDTEQFKNSAKLGILTTDTDFADNNAASWACWADQSTCSLSNDTNNKKFGTSSVKNTTSGAFDTYMKYPASGTANWNLTTYGSLSFWVYATNTNQDTFQGPTIVYLKDSAGNGYKFQSSAELWDGAIGGWKRFDIPLAGDTTWTRTVLGSPNFNNIDYVEVHADTWGAGFTFSIDGIGFIRDFTDDPNLTVWPCFDNGQFPGCSANRVTTKVREGTASVKHTVPNTATWGFTRYPDYDMNLNATGKNLVFWLYMENGDFTGASPRVSLESWSPNMGVFEYTTTQNLVDGTKGRWQRFEIPVEGNSFWTRTTTGPASLADIDRIGIFFDNIGTQGYEVYIDGLRLENKDTQSPSTNITSPTAGQNIAGAVLAKANASDNAAVKRVDFFVDGQYFGTDALSPYSAVWIPTSMGNHTFTSKAYDMIGNVTTSAGVTANITAIPGSGGHLLRDDFELGFPVGWGTEIDTENDLGVTMGSALHGSFGVAAIIDNETDMYMSDTNPDSESRLRSRFYLDPNSMTIPSGESFSVMVGRNSGSVYLVQLGYSSSSGYRARTSIYNDAGSITNGAWVPITDAPHAFEIDWKAATSSGANNGYITFWIDGSQQYTQNGIDNDTKRIDEIRFGAPDSVDAGTNGTLYLDEYVTTENTYIGTLEGPSDVIFSDGFESGNTGSWSQEEDAESDLTVTTGSALDGTYGLSTLIDNTTSMYVKSLFTPDMSRYRARFYLDPNSITMASSDTFNIFSGRTSAGWTFSVVLNYTTSSGYRVRTQIYDDSGAATNGAWVNISDASHYLEIDWKASSASGANDGYITLWLDGVSSDSQTGIDNDTKRVNEARLGAVANIDSGTTGTIYLDKFQANKTEYIGP